MLFADDTHVRWELKSFQQYKQMCHDIDKVFALFCRLGLQVNASKSRLLVSEEGLEADRWLRKRKRKDAKGKWTLRYNKFTKASLVLSSEFKCLGAVLSYGRFEALTAQHRLAQAQGHKQRLQRILQGRGGLTLPQRVRLWVTCVQSAQHYGLDAVGVTPALLRKIHTQTLQHLRALAGSPRHITRESDSDLLSRLGVDSPKDVLKRSIQRRWGQLSQADSMTCVNRQRIREWVGGLLQALEPDQSQAGKADCQDPVPAPVPSAEPVAYACQVRGQVFHDIHQLKSHEGRAHKVFARFEDVFDKSVHAQGGLPNCRLCGQEASRWSALKTRINRKSCTGLRREHVAAGSEAASGQTKAQSLPGAPSEPEAIKCHEKTSTKEAWCEGPTTATGEAALSWPNARAHQGPWQALVKLPQVRERLRQHCGFCGQWVAKNTGIKLHLCKAHADIWNAHHADLLKVKGIAKVAARSLWR